MVVIELGRVLYILISANQGQFVFKHFITTYTNEIGCDINKVNEGFDGLQNVYRTDRMK